jgi:N-acetylmuramoyl-L-alanine amidase
MRDINKIIIHCAATPEGVDHSVEEIEKWHIERGFRKIGYHYIISIDGKIYTGRDEDEIGAHCQGYNKNSIGICYIGGLAKDWKTPKDTRTEEQKQALLFLLKKLKSKYPNATIHGHREFANKACPCFDVQKEYSHI